MILNRLLPYYKKQNSIVPSLKLSQRFCSSSPHTKPKYTGAEAVVRKYLPEDHHIVLANIASWFAIYGLYKVTFGGKETPVVEAPATSPKYSGDVPSLFDEGFEEFIKQPGNEERYVKSIESWASAQ